MKNLKKVRTACKISQQEIANKLNVSQSTYWGYETGKFEPNIDILIEMSKLFKVSIDYLVGNENNFTIDLSNLPKIKIELLQDILSLDETDAIFRWRAMKERIQEEIENPERTKQEKLDRIYQLEEEHEAFIRRWERAGKQNNKDNK